MLRSITLKSWQRYYSHLLGTDKKQLLCILHLVLNSSTLHTNTNYKPTMKLQQQCSKGLFCYYFSILSLWQWLFLKRRVLKDLKESYFFLGVRGLSEVAYFLWWKNKLNLIFSQQTKRGQMRSYWYRGSNIHVVCKDVLNKNEKASGMS